MIATVCRDDVQSLIRLSCPPPSEFIDQLTEPLTQTRLTLAGQLQLQRLLPVRVSDSRRPPPGHLSGRLSLSGRFTPGGRRVNTRLLQPPRAADIFTPVSIKLHQPLLHFRLAFKIMVRMNVGSYGLRSCSYYFSYQLLYRLHTASETKKNI